MSVLFLWVFGGTAFALIVFLFTPYTHNLDDIKVTLQYVLGPIVWGAFAVAVWCGHIRRIHPVVLLSLFAFLLVYLASTVLWAAFPWRAWRDLGYQLTIMAPFIVVVGTCTNEERFRNACLFFFLVGCGTVFFGIFHYFGGMGQLLDYIYPQGPPHDRVAPLYTLLYTLRQNGDMLSTILNRDFYPAYLLMIVPLAIAMALYYRNIGAKIFFILMFFLMCICIILAFSKDTYLALFLMVALWVFMYAARRNWRAIPRRVLWLWTVGGLFVFATVLVCVREKFYGLDYENFVSIQSRRVIWGGAIGIFFDLSRPFLTFIKYIFLGGGGGAFYLMFPIYRDANYHLYEISNVTLFAHNQYLGLLCEQGLLGLGAFLTFLIVISRFIVREAWRKPEHPINVYQIALATSVLGISFQNFFSPNIRWTVCGFNYWYLLGLVVAAFHLTFSQEKWQRIERFYDFSPKLRQAVIVSFLAFALLFEAISIPYGLTRFNAAKNNNDGLIFLQQEFSPLCARVKQNPNDPRWRELARKSGLNTIERFRRALAWQPFFITSHYKLAHVYSLMAEPVENDPTTSPTVRRARQMHWWELAEKTYNELAYFAPDYSEIHLNYGILGGAFYAESRNPEHLRTSLLEYQKAVKMSNKLQVQWLYIQRLHQASMAANTTGRSDPATVEILTDALERIVPADETHESIRQGLVECRKLADAGDCAQAAPLLASLYIDLSIKVYERMPSLRNNVEKEADGFIAESYEEVARYYLRQGRAAEALPALEAQLLGRPETVPALHVGTLNNYAAAAVHACEYRRCLEVLSKVIQRNPLDWASRQAALGVLEQIGDHQRALKQAEALHQIVQEIYKTNPDYNDPEKGPGLRARAGGLPVPAQTLYQVGRAMKQTGQLKDAFTTLYKVVDLDTKGEWGKKAQHLINEIERDVEQAADRSKPVGANDKATTPAASSQP